MNDPLHLFQSILDREVGGFDVEGMLEALDCPRVKLDGGIGAAEVVPGEVVSAVAAAGSGLLQPFDGVGRFAEFDQVGADVVIGVAIAGIDSDGGAALGDRVFPPVLKTVNPTQIRVRLGGGWISIERK